MPRKTHHPDNMHEDEYPWQKAIDEERNAVFHNAQELRNPDDPNRERRRMLLDVRLCKLSALLDNAPERLVCKPIPLGLVEETARESIKEELPEDAWDGWEGQQ